MHPYATFEDDHVEVENRDVVLRLLNPHLVLHLHLHHHHHQRRLRLLYQQQVLLVQMDVPDVCLFDNVIITVHVLQVHP